MRNLDELNINDGGGRPVMREPPRDALIESFERHYGVRFPPDYVGLLKFSNGGHPELDTIVPIANPEVGEWSVNNFYFLSADRNSFESLWREMEIWCPILGKEAVPFACDGGGNPFFLDLSRDPPSVRLCIHDENYRIIDIAPTFADLIDGLNILDDMI